MIAHLNGTVEKISDSSVVLDVNGVGYSVICSTRTINNAQISSRLKLYTEMVVREDSWTLYGFLSEQEKFWFNTLTSVQGVGGRVAIAILSALSDEDIYNGFLSGDKNTFTRASGVGPKLSLRIISELKDKIVGKIDVIQNTEISTQSTIVNDVISALINLGYQRGDIVSAISKIEGADILSFDDLLKLTLNKVATGS